LHDGRHGRSVRYVESRSETMLTITDGRAQVHDVALGATRTGTLTGLRVRVTADCGAYPAEMMSLPGLTGLISAACTGSTAWTSPTAAS
jgi:carbon-monoxide dehydrogenase large subunit